MEIYIVDMWLQNRIPNNQITAVNERLKSFYVSGPFNEIVVNVAKLTNQTPIQIMQWQVVDNNRAQAVLVMVRPLTNQSVTQISATLQQFMQAGKGKQKLTRILGPYQTTEMRLNNHTNLYPVYY